MHRLWPDDRIRIILSLLPGDERGSSLLAQIIDPEFDSLSGIFSPCKVPGIHEKDWKIVGGQAYLRKHKQLNTNWAS
jgi:hypothetical protein